jgi:hypothetical protein
MSFGKSKGGGRRLAKREAAPVLVSYTTLAGNCSAVLIDVSRTGARLRGDALPAAGDELVLTMDRMRTFATVAWATDGECGVAFDMALPPDEIHRLKQSVAAAAMWAPEFRAAYEDWRVGAAR